MREYGYARNLHGNRTQSLVEAFGINRFDETSGEYAKQTFVFPIVKGIMYIRISESSVC